MPASFLLRIGGPIRDALNGSFRRQAGGSARPVFFDIDATYPALRRLDAAFDEIRAELLGVLPESARIPRYHEIDVSQTAISGKGETSWRVFMLHMAGNAGALSQRALCPRTVAAIDGVPNVLQAFFSILEPRKSVPAHEGPYLGYLRYHLPLVVPRERPPRLRVKDRLHTWKERESILFDDSWSHEVQNESDEVRVVLCVDVMRPMPWPLHLLNASWYRYKRLAGAYPEPDAAALRPPGAG